MRPYEAYPRVLDLLGARAGETLLDVSCGTGHLLRAAWARGVRAVGVDLSDAAARVAHGAVPAAPVATCSGEALCLRSGQFDYVTCLGSLEHFLDIEAGLAEMRRVARSTARVAIMVPNRRFLGWRLLGRRGTAQQDISETLLSLGEWRARFAAAGFAEVAVYPDHWQAERLRRGGMGPFGRVAGQLWRVLPLKFEYQFIFVLRLSSAASS
jgi:SAM-dependent methyltransferase